MHQEKADIIRQKKSNGYQLPPELFLLFLLSAVLLLSCGREGALGLGATVPFPNDFFFWATAPPLSAALFVPLGKLSLIFVKDPDFAFIEAIKSELALPNIDIPPATPFG